MEKRLTFAPHGHILTNTAVWSPDSQWIVYDIRSDPAGAIFDGTRIERVHVATGQVEVLYESRFGACCGVATCSPVDDRVVFILGPEHPTANWTYSPCHRRGVIVNARKPGLLVNLDARDLVPPFTPGALRGGTHLHTFSGDGKWVAFTYEDHLLSEYAAHPHGPNDSEVDFNQRNVGVCVPDLAVHPSRLHPQNHDGTHFSVLVTKTWNTPRPGSNEIRWACEEAWVGTKGYLDTDGTQRRRALAFLGEVLTVQGTCLREVFLADLPDDVTVPSEHGPMQGTPTQRPQPPHDVRQRRLTFTADRKYPGIQGPRHWLRSSPDGERIAFLMKDDAGIVQLWTISPRGGRLVQVTHNPWNIASAFSWSPDGSSIACIMDNSLFRIDADTGQSLRLSPRFPDRSAPRPEACVYSPDGGKIAFVRRVVQEQNEWNQIFVHFLTNGVSVK